MYNTTMFKLKCLVITAFLGMNSLTAFSADTKAVATPTPDEAIATQKENCTKNTAMEWSSTLNRCVGKVAARETRSAAASCDLETDVAAREKCHIQLAEKNSGLSSDTSTLNQGKTSGSLVMNAASAAAAYVMINGISSVAAKGSNSTCTSKKVLAVTSVAGIASDIFLKMKAKKKVKELEDKYKLETTTGTQEAQVKALEYLREEQVTVKEIASMEKKRNMLLMLGYGMASAWAIYEMTPYGKANADCMKPSSGGTEVAGNANTPPPATPPVVKP